MSEVPLYPRLERCFARRAFQRSACRGWCVQGHLTHKQTHPPRTLPQVCASGPRVVLGGVAFIYERGTPAFLGGLWGVARREKLLEFRGTSLMRKRSPPKDPPRTLGMGLR